MKTLETVQIEISSLQSKKNTSAIIVAAGDSSRMKGISKQFVPLCGIPVVARTMLNFQNCKAITEIIVVSKEENIADISKLAAIYEITKLKAVVCGGSNRMQSVFEGVKNCSSSAEYYAVHDGARPLATPELIENVVLSAWENLAAAPVVDLKDTIKKVENGKIIATMQRGMLKAVQTPQVFECEMFFRLISDAVKNGEEAPDDVYLCEKGGIGVHAVFGDYSNIKITTAEDLAIAEAILTNAQEG